MPPDVVGQLRVEGHRHDVVLHHTDGLTAGAVRDGPHVRESAPTAQHLHFVGVYRFDDGGAQEHAAERSRRNAVRVSVGVCDPRVVDIDVDYVTFALAPESVAFAGDVDTANLKVGLRV